MTPDFSHLKKYEITEATTAEYKFVRIEGDPSIIFRPAHEVNESWLLARTAANIALAKQINNVKSGELVPTDIKRQADQERETDRKLIAFHCAVSWGTPPKDAKGKDVEFSHDNCHAFLEAIGIAMFDPVRGFVGNLYNFYPERRFAELDAAPLGNSSAEA